MDSKQFDDVWVIPCLAEDIHNAIELLAERNNLTFNTLIIYAVEQYILNISHVYSMAQFINTRTEEEKEAILKLEETYPFGFRQFTNAQRKYPCAGLLKPNEDVPELTKQLWSKKEDSKC